MPLGRQITDIKHDPTTAQTSRWAVRIWNTYVRTDHHPRLRPDRIHRAT